MEIDKIVADLKKERDRLVSAIAALVGVAAFAAGRRQRRAAGRAKFATFPVFELAALAAQYLDPVRRDRLANLPVAATLSSGRLQA